MKYFTQLYFQVALISLFTLFSNYAQAEYKFGDPEYLLDGTVLYYQYQSGDAVRVQFADGKARYEWVAGPKKGSGDENIPYNSRQIDENVYLVQWLQKERPDFLTLHIDLNRRVIFSSGIMRYGTAEQFVVFDGGIIQGVQTEE
ncbi:MoaF N-terminal domain-containing protein [Chitinimonas sp. PSY-7]|uniref:MoaF N-terminal domain-containing protein n=1 Tax=Chitinimonas sp. PSY-7 TaxID=3459088 RepID=UPI0040403181